MKTRLCLGIVMFIVIACHDVGAIDTDTDSQETNLSKQTTSTAPESSIPSDSASDTISDSSTDTTITLPLNRESDAMSDTGTDMALDTSDIPALTLPTCKRDSVEEFEATTLIRGIAMGINGCLCASTNGWNNEFTMNWGCYFGKVDDVKMTPALDNSASIESAIKRQLAASDISCLPTSVPLYDLVEGEYGEMRNTLATECDYPVDSFYWFYADVDENGQIHLWHDPNNPDTDFQQTAECADAILEERQFPCLANSEIEPFPHSIIE